MNTKLKAALLTALTLGLFGIVMYLCTVIPYVMSIVGVLLLFSTLTTLTFTFFQMVILDKEREEMEKRNNQ